MSGTSRALSSGTPGPGPASRARKRMLAPPHAAALNRVDNGVPFQTVSECSPGRKHRRHIAVAAPNIRRWHRRTGCRPRR